MQKHFFTESGPLFSRIGLGTWAMGGPWQYGWGECDDDESIAAIHHAIDLGINWIDTAPVYGLGHSEELVARAFKPVKNRIKVATKCGLAWNSKGKVRHDLSPVLVERELEASLKRLQLDVIDLYQIHWPDPKFPIEKAVQSAARTTSAC